MHTISMNKAMSHKAVPLSVVDRWWIKNQSIEQCLVLPSYQADNNGNNNDKGRMV